MSNQLTGDYEAVLQVGLRQINGILATMHQSRLDPDASPTFPHNGSVRIGDTPPWLESEPSRFAKWVELAAPIESVTADMIVSARDALLPKTPPGAVGRLQDELAILSTDRLSAATSGRARGLAEF